MMALALAVAWVETRNGTCRSSGMFLNPDHGHWVVQSERRDEVNLVMISGYALKRYGLWSLMVLSTTLRVRL